MKKVWKKLLALALAAAVVGGTIAWMNMRYIKEPELDPAILERIDLSEKSEAQRNYIITALKQEYENRPDVSSVELNSKHYLVIHLTHDKSILPWYSDLGTTIYLDLYNKNNDIGQREPSKGRLTEKEGREHIQYGVINDHYYEILPYYYTEWEAFLFRFPSSIGWEVGLQHAFGSFSLIGFSKSMRTENGMKILEEFSLKYEEILKNCPKE